MSCELKELLYLKVKALRTARAAVTPQGSSPPGHTRTSYPYCKSLSWHHTQSYSSCIMQSAISSVTRHRKNIISWFLLIQSHEDEMQPQNRAHSIHPSCYHPKVVVSWTDSKRTDQSVSYKVTNSTVCHYN